MADKIVSPATAQMIRNIKDGAIVAGKASEAETAENAEIAEKLGEETVGSSTEPIYLLSGVPTKVSTESMTVGKATEATHATSADKATADASGNTITTFYGHNLTFEMDSSTFVLTVKLLNADGSVLATQSVDLPLESVVVSGKYDDDQKVVILTLQNGSAVQFSVADLIDGLSSVSEQTIQIDPSEWSSNAATVTVDKVTGSSIVQLTAVDGSSEAVATNYIRVTTQGTNSLTFACDSTPSSAVSFKAIITN